MRMKSTPVQGPSSSAGLMRFFDISGGGLQIPPELVLGIAVAFLAFEIAAWVLL